MKKNNNLNFYYIMFKNNKNYKSRTYRYFKLWFISILIFSIFILIFQFIVNNTYLIKDDDIYEYQMMKYITPSHPPPLFNFYND